MRFSCREEEYDLCHPMEYSDMREQSKAIQDTFRGYWNWLGYFISEGLYQTVMVSEEPPYATTYPLK